MRAEEFYQNRKNDWEALGKLVKQGQRDIARLSPKDIDRLAMLYRTVTSDLALAQRISRATRSRNT